MKKNNIPGVKPLKSRGTVEEKVRLYKKVEAGMATAHDLVHLSFLQGMIIATQYNDFLKINEDYG